ncbi:hypothetical protein Slin15195_G091030 [Septoria linicola]|uniref:F-box domain-containing protein n=1 Tax=Septoria linicola TaxID=215465 RepID=A0A9Q9EMS5_9PEZI|nr:hypothetical protein Slin15195_G091030 [Septoria linicola]
MAHTTCAIALIKELSALTVDKLDTNAKVRDLAIGQARKLAIALQSPSAACRVLRLPELLIMILAKDVIMAKQLSALKRVNTIFREVIDETLQLRKKMQLETPGAGSVTDSALWYCRYDSLRSDPTFFLYPFRFTRTVLFCDADKGNNFRLEGSARCDCYQWAVQIELDPEWIEKNRTKTAGELFRGQLPCENPHASWRRMLCEPFHFGIGARSNHKYGHDTYEVWDVVLWGSRSTQPFRLDDMRSNTLEEVVKRCIKMTAKEWKRGFHNDAAGRLEQSDFLLTR